MKVCAAVLALGLALGGTGAAWAKTFKEAFPADYADVLDEYRAGLDKMNLQTGTVAIDNGRAEVTVPEGYYFVGPEDAAFILVDLWGNPSADGSLGLLFSADNSPLSDGWAVDVSFDEMGYVSDEDADSYDYGAMLTEMQADVAASSAERVKQGFESIELLGWAEPPSYDKAERKLYWAKRLKFGGTEHETLNYNIRVLGRHGVMVVNFIASMDQLSEVKAAAPAVMKMITFTDGNRYADFLPGVDTVAAVGIGGLIAGKVAAKTGLLIVLLAFAKKFIFLLLVPVLGLFGWIKSKMTGGRSS